MKDPKTGEFTKYIRATELKAGDTAVQFLPPPTEEVQKFMDQGFTIPSAKSLQAVATSGITPQSTEVVSQGGLSPQTPVTSSSYEQKSTKQIPEHVSSNDELTKSFQQKRGKAIVQ